MKINNFYGNFFIRGTDLLALPNCTPDSVFSFDLVHDEQSISSGMVTIQSALLYTTSDGERRIRVATQAFPVTSRTSELMASIDAEAVATLLSKQAMDIGLRSNLKLLNTQKLAKKLLGYHIFSKSQMTSNKMVHKQKLFLEPFFMCFPVV